MNRSIRKSNYTCVFCLGKFTQHNFKLHSQRCITRRKYFYSPEELEPAEVKRIKESLKLYKEY